MTNRHAPRRALVLAAALAFFSCAAPQRPSGQTPLPDDLAVAEAVFRHLRGHNSSGQKEKAEVFFLELRGEDPPPCLLERFTGEEPPVLPASAAARSAGIVCDPRTGARGLILRVESIDFPAPDRARVEGGYYEAPLSASGSTYLLERKSGAWEVVEEQRKWISSRPAQRPPVLSEARATRSSTSRPGLIGAPSKPSGPSGRRARSAERGGNRLGDLLD